MNIETIREKTKAALAAKDTSQIVELSNLTQKAYEDTLGAKCQFTTTSFNDLLFIQNFIIKEKHDMEIKRKRA